MDKILSMKQSTTTRERNLRLEELLQMRERNMWTQRTEILGFQIRNPGISPVHVPFRHPSLVQNSIYTLDQSNDSLYRLPKFYTPPLHSYPPPMTIISAETKTSPRRSLSASGYVVRDGIVRLTGKPGEVRTPMLKAPKLMHRKPVPTALVAEFIQSFKELDSYK
jgi:hypothetical protein